MKIQLPKSIYLEQLGVMKQILNLAEFKFDKRTKEYLYFKSQVMDNFYNGLKKLFKKLTEEKMIEKCKCGTNVRHGYKQCLCGGSGFINKQEDKKI